jgi:hypothetical protein
MLFALFACIERLCIDLKNTVADFQSRVRNSSYFENKGLDSIQHDVN